MIKKQNQKFKYCTICGKKISWFRKLLMWQLDKDPMHLIPLGQFCDSNCANEGLIKMLKEIEK
jgi:hypothetical protein